MDIRFHLDEHVALVVASGLRVHWVNVTTARDPGLLGSSDEAHVAFALTEGRVLVTHDRDYLVHHGRGIPHAGICYCHQDKLSIGDMVRAIVLLHSSSTDEIAGCNSGISPRHRLRILNR